MKISGGLRRIAEKTTMVGLDLDFDHIDPYPLNSRVRVHDDYGTVRYYGEIKGYDGLWVGIEWDLPERGKHSGCINNVQYFETTCPSSGSMIRPARIPKFQSVAEAIEERYIPQLDFQVDENLMHEVQASLKASIFEFVGGEKLSKKLSHREDLVDISVANANVNSAGYLKLYCNLVSLNLTGTLIWNWHSVADIVKQLPNLESLNLSHNRIVIPTEEQIEYLAPSFATLKEINLSSCGLSKWTNVLTVAALWPNIQSLSLQNNGLSQLSVPDTSEIFKCLESLDLHSNDLKDFSEILKLGGIRTLKRLFLMQNGIQRLQLPDCPPSDYVALFPHLEEINLRDNVITDELAAFNELDKLERLASVSKSPAKDAGFEEMFARAVALISGLRQLNKITITPKMRRDAEVDIWKQLGMEYVAAQKGNEVERAQFQLKCRAYSRIVKKLGSPEELMIRPEVKKASTITVNLVDVESGRTVKKRMPLQMSLQTLKGLVMKLFPSGGGAMPELSYVDAELNDIRVTMDNMNKTLDYYSIREGDKVLIKW